MTSHQEKQQGAALITVLLLTATLAVIAIGMTSLMTQSFRRATASEAREQAFWAMQGIEAAALQYLKEQGEAIDQPQGPLFLQPVVLPFDGVTATIRFSERSNCFNINDLLAPGEDGTLVADEAAAERFAGLIEAIGGSRAAGIGLAARVADFADSDDRPGPGSSDDFDYRRREVPYRTASQLLASVTELRAISGFSRDIYRRLAPYLCALPSDEAQKMNVNSLTPEEAPLLQAVFGEAMTVTGTRQIIDGRTPAGFADVTAFLEQPLLSGRDVPTDLANMLSAQSGLIEMEIVLESDIGRLRQTSLVERAEGGNPRVLSRQVGERLP